MKRTLLWKRARRSNVELNVQIRNHYLAVKDLIKYLTINSII